MAVPSCVVRGLAAVVGAFALPTAVYRVIGWAEDDHLFCLTAYSMVFFALCVPGAILAVIIVDQFIARPPTASR